MSAHSARDRIKKAIKDAGGVYAVAGRSGVHFTRVYAFLRGSGMESKNASRLRAALPDVAADVWADVFAPPSVPEQEAAQ